MVSRCGANIIEQSFALVCKRLPAVKKAYDQYAQLSLADYLQRTLKVSNNPLLPRTDLIEVVYRYASPLLGEVIAEKAAQELQSFPVVLTSNHHGVDFLAQSVQGGLIFSLRKIAGKPATTVPVFACGNVPLNNPTYPQGLLLYHARRQVTLPLKLPIFPNRLKRCSVSVTAPYDADMLNRAERRLAAMMQDGQLPPVMVSTVEKIFNEHYRDRSIMGLESYSQQAVVLNNRIWKRCFREPEQAPEMVYLELEKITSLLLQEDLSREDSLVWQLMFNPVLRAEVLRQLDGTKVCWDRTKLAKRMCSNSAGENLGLGGSGTIFFWAINDTGWRVPLMLTDSAGRSQALQGRDDRGKLWTVPFSPRDILQGLQAGQLLPSLFTCYLTIGLARGVSCCGGYFQAEYLASIQDGLVQILLDKLVGFKREAESLSQVRTDISLVGMQAVVHNYNDDLLLPAGPVEIIASGGLRSEQFDRMPAIAVQDALLAGLLEILPDVQGREERQTNWCMQIAKEYSQVLRDRSIVL